MTLLTELREMREKWEARAFSYDHNRRWAVCGSCAERTAKAMLDLALEMMSSLDALIAKHEGDDDGR